VFFASYEVSKLLDSALIDTLVPLEQKPLFPLPSPTTSRTSRRLEDVNAPALAAKSRRSSHAVSTPYENTSLIGRVDHPLSETHNVSVVIKAGGLLNLQAVWRRESSSRGASRTRRNSDAISFSETLSSRRESVNQLRMQYSRLAPSFEARKANRWC
jgi:hypothetical protein